jgi:hypothetical protein
MPNTVEATLNNLVDTLARHPSIRAIGMSGGERPFPKPGEGDIDLFVYCSQIPTLEDRQELLLCLRGEIEQVQVGKLAGGHWGPGDCLSLAGIETWLLYFTVAGTCAELEAILSGQYLGRQDSYYYPIGRCAMWQTMRAFYDPDGFLMDLRECLAEYPQHLRSAMIRYHLEALDDVEDLERAVGRRDVFFFHFALDLALDHFLQAVFALNKEYFPSRKRSEAYLRGFEIKPAECEPRLRQVVVLGGNASTLEQAYSLWNDLVHDVQRLAAQD